MDRIAGFRGMRLGLVLGAAIALMGFGMGIAVASIPSGGVISGCYKTTTGALRVINYPAKKCVTGEKLIRWDQAGAAATVTLAEMVGTTCTVGPGRTAKLHAEVNPGTGVVTLRCDTVLRVSGTATFTRILMSSPSNGASVECLGAKTCQLNLPLGTADASVQLYAPTRFFYTCPGTATQGAYSDVSGTVWQAQCNAVVMTTDLVIPTTP